MKVLVTAKRVIDPYVKVRVKSGATVRKLADKSELVVSVPSGGESATLSIEYQW